MRSPGKVIEHVKFDPLMLWPGRAFLVELMHAQFVDRLKLWAKSDVPCSGSMTKAAH